MSSKLTNFEAVEECQVGSLHLFVLLTLCAYDDSVAIHVDADGWSVGKGEIRQAVLGKVGKLKISASYRVLAAMYNDRGKTNQITVVWAARNDDVGPTKYGWRNKVIQDAKGRFFAPKEGKRSKQIQPGDRTGNNAEFV